LVWVSSVPRGSVVGMGVHLIECLCFKNETEFSCAKQSIPQM
jgi:hypothetical protein